MNTTSISLSWSGALFWIAVILEMAWAGYCFVNFIREYDNDLIVGGRHETHRSLGIAGFLFLCMPVLQVWQWLYGSKVWAVGLVVLALVFWGFTIKNALAKTNRGEG